MLFSDRSERELAIIAVVAEKTQSLLEIQG